MAFVERGLALGFIPPSAFPLVFDFLCVPPLPTSPSAAGGRAGIAFSFALGFLFSRAFVFSSCLVVLVERTIASSSETGKATPSRELITVYVKMLKQEEYFPGVQKPLVEVTSPPSSCQ